MNIKAKEFYKLETLLFIILTRHMIDGLILNKDMPIGLRYITATIMYGSKDDKEKLEKELKLCRDKK